MHEIYGSICELKCESGFGWSIFPLTTIIFDWVWPKGCIVNIKFSLPDHRAIFSSLASLKILLLVAQGILRTFFFSRFIIRKENCLNHRDQIEVLL